MRLLLDTHVWLWRLLDPERIPTPAEMAISDPHSELLLSPISTWVTADGAMHEYEPVDTLW